MPALKPPGEFDTTLDPVKNPRETIATTRRRLNLLITDGFI
jgi:hypothetical protein